MTACSKFVAIGSEGRTAPPINPLAQRQPVRLQRTRRRDARTPAGAVYVGRPTVWGNPFSDRPKIGHARSVILYRSWLDGDLSPRVLRAAAFDEPEINGLYRWRRRLIACLHQLRGRDLQCWCPLTSSWCHADALLRSANPELCR
ncbi:DUF4326 domain-containing protein [Sphingomonas elodea]|uniref:DUF4326 domain-containing protein n=1 Tax=Sphingomonas elodea TaxID=179878 RepID=UPI0002631092|nr:DUF4326 domain-containing protein [Sphingomonas elodea]